MILQTEKVLALIEENKEQLADIRAGLHPEVWSGDVEVGDGLVGLDIDYVELATSFLTVFEKYPPQEFELMWEYAPIGNPKWHRKKGTQVWRLV